MEKKGESEIKKMALELWELYCERFASIREAERALGIGNGTSRSWYAEGARGPALENAVEICRALGLSMDASLLANQDVSRLHSPRLATENLRSEEGQPEYGIPEGAIIRARVGPPPYRVSDQYFAARRGSRVVVVTDPADPDIIGVAECWIDGGSGGEHWFGQS